jgi:uncharacterized RDD family membrane protein YckC
MYNTSAPSTPKYAGFWIRALAIIIDWVILAIIGKVFFGDQVTSFNDGTFRVSYTGWRVIVPLSFALFFWIWKSATPGKMALKLKIVNQEGSSLTPKQSIIRLLSYAADIAIVGLIWVGIDAKKQCWHDKIAHTFVIKTN